MLSFILVVLVTAVSLFIISRLNIAIEIDDFGTALWAALAVGVINGLLGPIARFLSFPLILLTLGLFALIINALLFALAAAVVPGFRLKGGFLGALLGSVLLSVLNWLIFLIVPG